MNKKASLTLFVLLLATVVTSVVFAATRTLNGNSGCPLNSGWTTTGCWQGGVVPVTGDDVVIESPGESQTTYDLGAGVQLHSITINSANNTINLLGGPIVLQSGGFITNNWDAGGPFGALSGVTLN